MKQLILILFLFSQLSFSQNLLLFSDSGYEAEASLYFSSMATPLSSAQKTRINTLVKMLKDTLGVSSLSLKFNFIHLYANETAEASLKNLVKRDHDGSNINNHTWTQNEGYGGDTNTTRYINTDFIIITDGAGIYTQNSASLGIYSRSDANSAGYAIGQLAGVSALIRIRYSSNLSIYLNTSAGQTAINSNSSGLFVVSRTASDLTTAYRNGASIGTTTQVSGSLASLNRALFVGCYNDNGSPGGFVPYQISIAFAGAGFTAIENRGIKNCFEWYMDALGKGVIP